MIKIAINGFGRIGRSVFKVIKQNKNLEIILINDLTDKATLEHLLKYDSVYGKSDLNLDNIKLTNNPEPNLKADIVIESTGRFTNFKDANKHNAKLVIITAPAKNTPHFVYGVNCAQYNGEKVISAGSCTTVAASYVLSKLKVKKAFLTTMHAYTATQKLVDGPHKDLRRARAANLNMIPTTTGAAEAVCKVLPELKGKLFAQAIRVPVPIVSLIEIIAEAENFDEKLFDVNKEPLVSSDFIGDPRPAIIDSIEKQGNLVRILAWYDNEYGYSVQLVKLLEAIYEAKN